MAEPETAGEESGGGTSDQVSRSAVDGRDFVDDFVLSICSRN